MKITRKTLYSFYAVIGFVLLLLLGLTFYNYSKGGEFNFTSLILTAMLLLATYVVRISTEIED